MPEELDLLNQDVILQILTETNKSESKDRRINSFDAYQVYSGNQRVYIEKQLAKTRPKSWPSYTISNISVSKIVTEKRAQAYSEGAIRTVTGSNEEQVELKSEMLSDIYDQAGATRELRFHDIVMNLNKHDLIWVNYRDEEKKYQFMTLQPFEFVLVRDKDTGELLIVGLNYPDSEITQNARNAGDASSGDGISDLIAESQTDSAAQGEVWVFWSANQHVKVEIKTVRDLIDGQEVLKKNVDFIEIPGNPKNVNPLGIIPFVYTSLDPSVDYPTKNPLTEQSVTFNVQQSETLTAKNIHGSGIQVFSYPEKLGGRFKEMNHGQTQAIHLPQSSKEGDPPTSFEYKTSGAQLGPMLNSDLNYLQQILKEHEIEGVKMDLGESSAMSGISRAIAGASVQKVVERHQALYAETERQMFKIVKAWDKINKTRMFSEDDELEIVFPKPKVMVSDRETLENIEKMLDLGLIEEWEKFIKMDPNLKEPQAKEKLDRINQAKEKRAQRLLSRGMDGNQQERVGEEGEAQPQGAESGAESES